jgi:uncharacterized membrane protein
LTGESLEERLRRVEETLALILGKIEELEKLVREGMGEGALTAARLTIAYSIPAIQALQAARRLLELTSKTTYRLDDISRSILEVLSDCRGRSLLEIERQLRRSRGRASRRIIRDRLRRLMEMGFVKDEGSPNRHKYRLVNCP